MSAPARASALTLPLALAIPVAAQATGPDAVPATAPATAAALAPAQLTALRDAFTVHGAEHHRRGGHHGARAHASRIARVTKLGHVVAPAGAPRAVRRIIAAANRIATTPYVWGGGHGSWSAPGYDCSGSVSYALHGGRLLGTPMASGALAGYGRSGKGRWVSIYANGGHAYMVVAGLRFDTSAAKAAGGGSRWTRDLRGGTGFTVRHPAGL